jgi:hypothetical protein
MRRILRGKNILGHIQLSNGEQTWPVDQAKECRFVARVANRYQLQPVSVVIWYVCHTYVHYLDTVMRAG